MNAILELQELPVAEIDTDGELALASSVSNHCMTIID
ncbi:MULTISPECIES: class III lanthipeptide [unclassified Streptomyces]|nr:class III lanthipeptide [Streptomyces sp. NBC_01431]